MFDAVVEGTQTDVTVAALTAMDLAVCYGSLRLAVHPLVLVLMPMPMLMLMRDRGIWGIAGRSDPENHIRLALALTRFSLCS